jgi:predicted nucleotidyltransferase
MTEREMAEKSKILVIRTGSHLYGTSVPESDEDFMGLFVAPKRYYLGLESIKEVNCNIVSKSADGKNDKDAVDSKLYELKNFVRLAASGNPNIIELFFAKEDNIVAANFIGRRLLHNKFLFPSMLVKQRFIGYAVGQLHKAKEKPENFDNLTMFQTFYDSTIDNKRIVEMAYIRHPVTEFMSFYSDHVSIGGLNFNCNVKMRKVMDKVSTRIKNASHRQDMWTKYGFDTKFMMHCMRLIVEGQELLETGKIEFPLQEKQLLLDIRTGKFAFDEIHEMIIARKDKLEKSEGNLRTVPDFDKINELLIKLIEIFWENENNF